MKGKIDTITIPQKHISWWNSRDGEGKGLSFRLNNDSGSTIPRGKLVFDVSNTEIIGEMLGFEFSEDFRVDVIFDEPVANGGTIYKMLKFSEEGWEERMFEESFSSPVITERFDSAGIWPPGGIHTTGKVIAISENIETEPKSFDFDDSMTERLQALESLLVSEFN